MKSLIRDKVGIRRDTNWLGFGAIILFMHILVISILSIIIGSQ